VHELNDKPRRVLPCAGFIKSKPVKIHVADLPPEKRPPQSMKLNPDGDLCGDEYLLPPEAIRSLCEWLSAFDGPVGGVRHPAEVLLGVASVEQVVAPLKDMA